MADFDTAARREAERRYPAPEADADRLTYPREALRDGKRRAFEAGARWGASPLNMTTLRATFARAERAEAALAEAYEARDIAQGQWRWYQARADRAEALLAEVAALAGDMSDELDMLRAEPGPVALSYANCTAMDLRRIRAILARTEQTGADR